MCSGSRLRNMPMKSLSTSSMSASSSLEMPSFHRRFCYAHSAARINGFLARHALLRTAVMSKVRFCRGWRAPSCARSGDSEVQNRASIPTALLLLLLSGAPSCGSSYCPLGLPIPGSWPPGPERCGQAAMFLLVPPTSLLGEAGSPFGFAVLERLGPSFTDGVGCNAAQSMAKARGTGTSMAGDGTDQATSPMLSSSPRVLTSRHALSM